MKQVTTYVGIDAHKKDLFIAMLVGTAAVPVSWTVANEPNAVRRLVRKLEREAPGAVQVWRMRIARRIAVMMVPPMHGHPLEQRPLDGHGAHDRQSQSDRPDRLERPVGEQPMEPHGHTQNACGVHGQQGNELRPTEAVPPEQDDSRDQAEERKNDGEQNSDP